MLGITKALPTVVFTVSTHTLTLKKKKQLKSGKILFICVYIFNMCADQRIRMMSLDLDLLPWRNWKCIFLCMSHFPK